MTAAAYVYAITRVDTDRIVYIGKAIDTERRWYQHRKAARKGETQHLYRAMRKHGIDNFAMSPLFECASEEEAYACEVGLIAILRECGDELCNMSAGGDMPPNHRGKKKSQQTRERIRAARLGIKRPDVAVKLRGIKRSAETRAKVSAARKLQVITPETRAKLSAVRTGKKWSPEHRAAMLGKKRTPEQRARMRKARWGSVIALRAHRDLFDNDEGNS